MKRREGLTLGGETVPGDSWATSGDFKPLYSFFYCALARTENIEIDRLKKLNS